MALTPQAAKADYADIVKSNGFINFAKTIINSGGRQRTPSSSSSSSPTQPQQDSASIVSADRPNNSVRAYQPQQQCPRNTDTVHVVTTSVSLPHEELSDNPTKCSYLDVTRNSKTLPKLHNMENVKDNAESAKDGHQDTEQVARDLEPWKLYLPKKKQKKLTISKRVGIANTGLDDKFKATIVKVPLFISNVSKETTESDIKDYINQKTQEEVTLFKINRKTERSYNSFKLYVSKQKLNLFLNDEFWPSGISFRRFVHDKYRQRSVQQNGSLNIN